MATGKRFYWLKLYSDFFSSVRIKKLRKLAGGDTFLAIYLKMQLLAMQHDGVLRWSGVEDDFVTELALELDEDSDNVKVTMAYLLSCGLAETDDNVNFFFPFAVSNVGSEGTSAQRMRDARMAAKRNAEAMKIEANANNVQTTCAHCSTEIRDRDKSKEKEIDLTVSNDTVCRTSDVRRVVDAWNSLGLTQVEKVTGDSVRGKMLRARINEYGTDDVVDAVMRIKKSSFLRGQNKKGWTITFDWLVRPNNFTKVKEGQYDDSVHGNQSLREASSSNPFLREDI